MQRSCGIGYLQFTYLINTSSVLSRPCPSVSGSARSNAARAVWLICSRLQHICCDVQLCDCVSAAAGQQCRWPYLVTRHPGVTTAISRHQTTSDDISRQLPSAVIHRVPTKCRLSQRRVCTVNIQTLHTPSHNTARPSPPPV